MTDTRRRWLALAALAVLVALGHGLLLGGGGLWPSWQPPSAPAPVARFQTRTITPPPPAPVTEPVPAAAPPAAPKPQPKAPQPAAPVRAAAQTPPADAAPVTQTQTHSLEPLASSVDEGDARPVVVTEATVMDSFEEPPPPEASAGRIEVTPPGAGQPDVALHPVSVPPPVRLGFNVVGQVKRFDYTARAELVWQHDGQRYEARQEISAFLVGSRIQRSAGAVNAMGLQPERFSDKTRSEQAAHFDYAAGKVTFSANRPDIPISAGVQDRLSVFLQLGALLGAQPQRYREGTHISLLTVSARSADRWTFVVRGNDTQTLPVGTLQTLRLERVPQRDHDQNAELWIAPEWGYLPVRIRITQANGDFVDLVVRSRAEP